jgi:outer membrane cobalamin receptor
LLFLSVLPAFADDTGGSDYGAPFNAGARQSAGEGLDPSATATVIVVTGEDLIARGARTAADALQLAAGAYVYDLDRWPQRDERLLRVRGAAPSDVRVLLDGVPIEHGVFGTTDLRDLPADQIALIRIYPGPAPAIYGAEGGGAVVEILTRQAGDHFIGRFDSRFADHRSANFSLGLGDTYGAFQYFVAGDHDGAAGFPLPASFPRARNEEGGVRDNSAFARDHYRVRVGALIGSQAEFHLTGFYSRGEQDAPVDIGAVDPAFVRFPEVHRLGGQLNARAGAFGPFQVRADAYLFEYVEDTAQYAEETLTTLLSRSRLRNVRSGGDLTPVFDLGRFSRIAVTFGGRHDEIDFEIPDQFRERIKTNRLDAAADEEIKPTDWLQVSLGGGYGRLRATHAVNFTPGDPVAGWRARLGAVVGPFAGFSAHAVAGRNPRFPTIEEWFDPQLGNPNLRAALVDNYELGVDYALTTLLHFGAVGFIRGTQGAPQMTATSDAARPLVFTDDADFVTRGFTLTLDAAPVHGLTLRANYTRLQSFDGDGHAIDVYYLPKQTAAGEARYRFDFGLGAGVNTFYADQARAPVDGLVNTMPWYWLLGARVFYSYRDRIELYVQGWNLTDAYYETHPFYPEPGRTVEAGMKLTYF